MILPTGLQHNPNHSWKHWVIFSSYFIFCFKILQNSNCDPTGCTDISTSRQRSNFRQKQQLSWCGVGVPTCRSTAVQKNHLKVQKDWNYFILCIGCLIGWYLGGWLVAGYHVAWSSDGWLFTFLRSYDAWLLAWTVFSFYFFLFYPSTLDTFNFVCWACVTGGVDWLTRTRTIGLED